MPDWFLKVRTNGEWDHKQRILDLQDRAHFTEIPGTTAELSYEAWSNIHYGYVGNDVNFSSFVLHAGANIADQVSHGEVDPGDQAAIQIGINFREKYGPEELRPEHLHQAILENYEELRDAGKIRE